MSIALWVALIVYWFSGFFLGAWGVDRNWRRATDAVFGEKR